jgi:hypothetical protein
MRAFLLTHLSGVCLRIIRVEFFVHILASMTMSSVASIVRAGD